MVVNYLKNISIKIQEPRSYIKSRGSYNQSMVLFFVRFNGYLGAAFLTFRSPTFHALHLCLHVLDSVVVSVVFELVDVSELQVFVGASFVLVV